jgi:hypothetical protein
MKFFLIAAAMISMVATTTTSAQAESRQDFVLVNKTGYDISEVYISPAKADDWEDDILGSDENFDDDTQREIKFHRVGKTCFWDLKVVYDEDDSSAVWHDIDLCKVSKITIRYNKKSDTTSASFD